MECNSWGGNIEPSSSCINTQELGLLRFMDDGLISQLSREPRAAGGAHDSLTCSTNRRLKCAPLTRYSLAAPLEVLSGQGTRGNAGLARDGLDTFEVGNDSLKVWWCVYDSEEPKGSISFSVVDVSPRVSVALINSRLLGVIAFTATLIRVRIHHRLLSPFNIQGTSTCPVKLSTSTAIQEYERVC